MIKIAIGGDHAGFDYKGKITEFLSKEYQTAGFGALSTESVDYPDCAHPLAQAVAEKQYDFGILICGSANGVAITANKHKGIRAAICWTPEIAALARQHNNANVLCIPARFVSLETAFEMVKTFLNTDFEGGRHQTRVEKIDL